MYLHYVNIYSNLPLCSLSNRRERRPILGAKILCLSNPFVTTGYLPSVEALPEPAIRWRRAGRTRLL